MCSSRSGQHYSPPFETTLARGWLKRGGRIWDVFVSTAFFLLTLNKFAETMRGTTGVRWSVSGRDGRAVVPALFMFFRDACCYYFVVTRECSSRWWAQAVEG